MRFERTRAVEASRLAVRTLQLALCTAALVTMAIKFFVVALVVVVTCLGMLLAALDGFPHWLLDRYKGNADHGATPSRLSSLLTKHCPYSRSQTTDMLLAVLLLVAGVAFLASDTMDVVCDVDTSSTIDKATDAAESVIDSLGLGDDSSESSASSDGDGSTSFGCNVIKASVGCTLSAALLFLVTIALSCPPFTRPRETLEDGERATAAISGVGRSSESQDDADSDRGVEYHRLERSPRAETPPAQAP